ncbi:MAG: hypothetical protein K6G86_05885 [Bacteroidales bacterium]|nr:hypothetical protein [Bacteroidales bacterium]
MKKILMAMAAAACCTALFTSCGKNNPDQPEAPDTTPAAAVMDYQFTVTDDLFNAFTLTVEYYDAAGAVKTETMTSKEWTKKVKTDKLPATLGARVSIKLKDGFDSSKEGVFSAKHYYGYEYYAVNKSNEKLGSTISNGSGGGVDMKYEKVPAYAERYLDKPIMSFVLNFAADGNATSGKWE